jgi:hypothetical protein
MINRVFAVSGNKIASLVVGETSLMFSSKSFSSLEEFNESWSKKLSMATKVEVKFDSIKSVKKEDGDEDISISYKTFAGITGSCVFSFSDPASYDTFFGYLQKERYYTKTQEQLSPFKAVSSHLIGLVVTIGITVFAYLEALKLAAGTAEVSGSRKARLFNTIVETLGDKGVLITGGLICAFIAYKIWTRFSNPPGQVKFLPLN